MTQLPELPGTSNNKITKSQPKNQLNNSTNNQPPKVDVKIDNQDIGQTENGLVGVVRSVKEDEIYRAKELMVNLHTKGLHELAELSKELTAATYEMIQDF